MKKIVVLAIALALVAGMPLLASELTFGGDLDWGFISNFDDQYNAGTKTATFDVKATVDDFNTVGVSFDVDANVDMEKAQLATNLGSAFKLPVGLASYVGYFNFSSEEYASLTGYDVSNLSAETGSRWQWAASIGIMDLLTLEIATPWDFAAVGSNVFVGAHGTFGPVSAEAWFNGGSAENHVGGSLAVELAVMEGSTLSLGAAVDTDVDAAVDSLDLGLAAAFEFGMFGVGVGFLGVSEEGVDFAQQLSAELSVTPLANVGVDVGALFVLPDPNSVLNNVDASLWYTAGAVKYRVGYLYVPDEATGIEARWNAVNPGTGADWGGFYLKAGLDY